MTDKNKCERISSCLDQREVDLWQLRELALSDGGLVNSESIYLPSFWCFYLALNRPLPQRIFSEEYRCLLLESPLNLFK